PPRLYRLIRWIGDHAARLEFPRAVFAHERVFVVAAAEDHRLVVHAADDERPARPRARGVVALEPDVEVRHDVVSAGKYRRRKGLLDHAADCIGPLISRRALASAPRALLRKETRVRREIPLVEISAVCDEQRADSLGIFEASQPLFG